MNLLKKKDAYIYGLLLADGSLYETTRNRGKISMELRIRDIGVLYMLEDFFSEYSCRIITRRRDTNFKKNYESCYIALHSLELRNIIKGFGFPAGKKCEIAKVPDCDYDEFSFWRGYLEGNGSFCMNAQGMPLVSMGTKSESLKNSYIDFLKRITGESKNINRNKRDNFYNIVSSRERAVELVRSLNFESSEYFIKQKKENALKILSWTRE